MANGFLYLISWYYNIELKTSENIFDFLNNVDTFEDAVKDLKKANEKSYGKKGKAVVDMNNAAIDAAAAELKEIKYDCEKWLHAEVKEIDIKKVHEQFVDEAEKILLNLN